MISSAAKCNLCDEKNFEIIENNEPPYKVMKCRRCSLTFIFPQPKSFELKNHYGENYYSKWITKQHKKRMKMWKVRLCKVEKLCFVGNLLDVGCGDSQFLQLAKQNGWDINGTEFSPYASNYASDSLNKNTSCGEIYEAQYSDNSFDVVTMWHVLEHNEDPKN